MQYVLSIIGLPEYSLKRALAPLGDFAAHIHDHFIPHARNNYHPHILGHRALALMSGLLVAMKIFTLTILSVGPILPAFSSAITPDNIFSLTNQSRQQYNLSALTENQMLTKAAQEKANDMLARGYFAHNAPDGRTPWSFITSAGYNYLMAGENLAVNFTEAENVETAWMNSPGHKANILNKNFQEIGIGIAQGTYQDHTAIFVVQEFGTPVEQKVSLSDKPTIVQNAAVPPPTEQTAPVKVASVAPAVKNSASPFLETAQAVPLAVNGQALGDAENKTVSPPIEPTPVSITAGQADLSGDKVNITATVSGPAVKVIAYFGEQAVMLLPKADNVWAGEVLAANLAQANATVRLKAFAMDGQSGSLQLADFSSGTIENYNLSGSVPPANTSFWGRTFNPKNLESRFYLFFLAALLSSLVLAIGIKRHIQHLSLIANSSFVAIFACLLWMMG